jgi:hypothetical protein
MTLLVLSIGFLQNLLDLLEDVLNPLNESGGFVDRKLIRGRVFLMQWKEEVKHQWVLRVGIPDPPEMGYGWWNYEEPYCNCVGHMGELSSHV